MKRNVILALIVLFSFDSLKAEAAHSNVVGLVELPSVFGTVDLDGPPGLISPAQIRAIPVYSHPTRTSPVIAEISDASSVETLEFDYEAFGAVVYKISDGWVLIRMSGSSENVFGWVSPRERGPFHPLVNLLKSGLNYLEDWDGVLYQKPGTNTTKRIDVTTKRQDVNVVGSAEHQEKLWLEVELLSPGHCEGKEPEALVKGWVPAHREDGNPKVWFYSRGC